MNAPLVFAFAIALFAVAGAPLPSFAQDAPVPAEEEKEDAKVKPYAHKSSKGTTYYLFSREQKLKNSDKVITMYYFAKDPENKKGTPVPEVPEDRVVSETKTGLLVLKKKK